MAVEYSLVLVQGETDQVENLEETENEAVSETVHEEETVNPILPTVPEMVWGGIFFAALLILFWAVLLPPIKRAMRARDDEVRDDREKAEAARVEAETLRREYEATLADARGEATRIIHEARTAADEHRLEVVAAAEQEVAERRREINEEVRAAREVASTDLRSAVFDLAVDAASKVLRQEVDRDRNREAVEHYVSGTGSL
ncbi:MAG: ATP synthase subunit b [Acidimicrobiales bacterium]|nr:MAG: ATP synthase F0 subunit B [Actinomycetota bacterium]MBV6508922.1 ATP synthase subunit b [Acidimicrobiales bacterium]RIK03056.1 MAG: ATP synthase F0 subunit B [Acidobacteriota bacterium]